MPFPTKDPLDFWLGSVLYSFTEKISLVSGYCMYKLLVSIRDKNIQHRQYKNAPLLTLRGNKAWLNHYDTEIVCRLLLNTIRKEVVFWLEKLELSSDHTCKNNTGSPHWALNSWEFPFFSFPNSGIIGSVLLHMTLYSFKLCNHLGAKHV